MGWRRFLRRGWWDQERARELQVHLDIETDDNIARGMPPDEARQAAYRKLGNPVRIREEIYSMNSIGVLDTLWQDLRYGARLFARSPGFTTVAVLTLALGIGGVTVIYSVIRNILLDPFPYTDSRRMVDVLIYDTSTGDFRGAMASNEFLDYQEQSDVFDGIIGTVSARGMMMPTREGAEALAVSQVTPNTFSFLGVPPLIGRGIIESDGGSTAPPIAVLSYKAWVGRFGADPGIAGRPITLDGTARTIVGVMPPRFTWHVADAWIPRPLVRGDPERAFWFQARVKPGVTLEEAEAQLNVIASRRMPQNRGDYAEKFHVSVITVIDFVVGRFRGVLYTLFAAVGLLLLIACCNVANMLLARATARERELTLRAALGAGQRRLVRQLMIESLLLALAGAAAGCLVAYGGIKAVAYFLPRQGVPYEVDLRLESSALLFSLGTAVVTAFLFGMLPAWHGARRDLVQGLKESGKGSGTSQGWVRNGLVVGEVALSLVLLLGAGVMMRSFIARVQRDVGFDPSKIVIAFVRFPAGGYRTPPEQQGYYRAAEERMGSLPGVIATGISSSWPFGGRSTDIERPGRTVEALKEGVFSLCSDGYLPTLGVGVIRGRLLSAADISGGRHVAVVNQALVVRHFGSENPIGQSIRLARLATLLQPVLDPTFEIVGVIGDIPNDGTSETIPAAYVPSSVTPGFPRMFVVRTAGDPAPMLNSIRRELRAVDRTVAVNEVSRVQELLQSSYAQPRFTMLILAAFAATGLLLVAVGVYGVMAYAVSRRAQEIAIRMALGADRPRMIREVLASGARLLVGGIVVGLIASLGTNRLLANDDWTTSAYDPLAMAAGIVVVLAMGLAACYYPALRAARVDPMTALRHE
jgi:putative ABC transport system permease protein